MKLHFRIICFYKNFAIAARTSNRRLTRNSPLSYFPPFSPRLSRFYSEIEKSPSIFQAQTTSGKDMSDKKGEGYRNEIEIKS